MILFLGERLSLPRKKILFPSGKEKESSSKPKVARFSPLRIIVLVTIILVITIAPLLLLYGGKNGLPFFGGGGGAPNERSGVVYPSVATLAGNSTIVVEATILNLNSSYCNAPHTGCLAGDFDFRANITSYFRGSGPETIYVGDISFEAPILSVGSEYVLFLSDDWMCFPSPPAAPCILPPTPLDITYHMIGGAQGKFLVKNGLVYGYRTLYPSDYSWMIVDANGVPLTQFKTQL